MRRAEISRRVRTIIVGELRCAPMRVTEDAEFAERLGATSLDKITIACGLENGFGIKLTDDEVAFCKTVGTAIDLVETKLENKTLLPRLREAGL